MVTCKSIIQSYIDSRLDRKQEVTVSTTEISLLSSYGVKYFNTLYSPDTYSRKFREWRNDIKIQKLSREKPIYIAAIEPRTSRQNYYKIKKITLK